MSQTAANAELTVTNLPWQKNDRMTAREIREQLYPNKMKAQHGTVQRLLQRLEEKGFGFGLLCTAVQQQMESYNPRDGNKQADFFFCRLVLARCSFGVLESAFFHWPKACFVFINIGLRGFPLSYCPC